MSGTIQNLTWAFEQSGISPVAKLLLIYIASNVGMSARLTFNVRDAGTFSCASGHEIVSAVNELKAAERIVVTGLDGDFITCALPWVGEIEIGRPAPARVLQYKAEIRLHLLAMQDGLCWYCGCDLHDQPETPHVEHQTPLCRGGVDALENLVMACEPCNLSKGRRTVDEYRRVLAEEDPSEPVRFYGDGL